MTEAVTQDAAVETETPRRRGRPRPQETIERDERVYSAIKSAENGVTRDDIATAVELSPKLVYMSLYRLRVSNRITREYRDGRHVWTAA